MYIHSLSILFLLFIIFVFFVNAVHLLFGIINKRIDDLVIGDGFGSCGGGTILTWIKTIEALRQHTTHNVSKHININFVDDGFD